MSGEDDRLERAADDLLALIAATREEPVGHLEARETARDRADLELLHGATVPQHAKPSRRSSTALGRVLVLLAALAVLVVLVLVVSAIAAAADDGRTATLSDDLDPVWWAVVGVCAACVAWEAYAWIRDEVRRRRKGGAR